MPSAARLPEILEQQLRRVQSQLIGVSLAEACGLTLLATAGALACGLVLDYLFEFPLAVRLCWLIGVPFVGLAVFCWKGLIPALRRYRQTELATIVEVAHPELRERLLSTVELARSDAEGEETGSPLMRGLLAEETVQFARQHDFADVVDSRSAIQRCWMGAIATLVMLLPLFFATESYGMMLARFFNPWGNYERVQNLMLIIESPDRVIGRGDDLEIRVRPEWRFQQGIIPESANFHWMSTPGESQSRGMDWHADQECYLLRLPRVMESFHYHVTASSSRSREHRIDVVDRPALQSVTADVKPPAYSDLPDQHHNPLLGELLVLEQSQIEMKLAFSKPVVTSEILWLDSSSPDPRHATALDESVQGLPIRHRTSLPVSEDGLSVHWKMTAALDQPVGRFVIRIQDEHQLTSRDETIHRLTVQQDAPPQLAFADREQVLEARPQDLIRIPVAASDDFGLGSLELHLEWPSNGTTKNQVIPVSSQIVRQREWTEEFVIDLAPLSLSPGTPVTLRARATDQRPVPGPNETWTNLRTLQIRIDAKAAGTQALTEFQHRASQAMAQLRSELEKQEQLARKLQSQARAENAKETAEQRSADAAKLEEKIEQLADQVNQLGAVMKQQPATEHLAKRAQQIADQQLSTAAAKAQAAQRAEGAQQASLLSEATNQLQKAEKELSNLQKDFEQISEMQRDLLELNRIADQVEKLADDVDGLVKRQVLNPTNVAARQQWQQDHRQLVSQHASLNSDLATVLDKHPGLMDRARETLQLRMAALADQAEAIARKEQSLANFTKTEIASRRQAWQSIRNQQEKSLQQSRQLLEDLKAFGLDSPPAAVGDQLIEATKSLESGDYSASEQRIRDTQKLWEEAATKLSEGDEQSPEREQFAQRARQLAETQQQLAGEMKKQRTSSAPMTSDPPASPRAAESIEMQQALLQSSRQLASGIRQLGLKDSPVNKQSTEVPDAARQASEALQQLNFKRAAEMANKAAEKSKKLAETLNSPDSPSVPEQIPQRATEIAQVQEQMAAALQQLAESPADQQAFRESLEKKTSQRTRDLSDELKQREADFKLPLIDRQTQGEMAKNGNDKTTQAQQALKDAQTQQAEMNSGQSVRSREQAVEALRQSAHLSRQASEGINPNRPPETQVPGEVGRQVAESSHRLDEAGVLLSQLQEIAAQRPGTDESNMRPQIEQVPSENKPGDENSTPQKSDKQESSAQQQSEKSNDTAKPMSPSEEGSASQESRKGNEQTARGEGEEVTSTTLREAAEGLRQAAHLMGLSRKGDQEQTGQQQAGRESEQSTSNEVGNRAFQAETHLQNLESSLGTRRGREWGKLPGQLKTEMIESSQRPRDPMYRSLIQRYFDEISRTRTPEIQPTP